MDTADRDDGSETAGHGDRTQTKMVLMDSCFEASRKPARLLSFGGKISRYPKVFIIADALMREAGSPFGSWLTFYNDFRQHQAWGYQTPREILQIATACG